MPNRRSPARTFLAATLVFALAAGCHTPLSATKAGSYESEPIERVVGTREGVGKQILLYLPNRIVDAFDMVHAGVGLGIPFGPDIRITKWLQLALQAEVGVGFGWDGRAHPPGWATSSVTSAFGPWRAGFGAGYAPHIGDWEVGVGLGANKVAVDLSEILDFVLGWFFIDILEDDYGYN